jgi:hypothetical protein
MDLLKLEEEMPNFENHEQAKQWFKNIYHNYFIIRSSNTWAGKKTYLYHIVRDLNLYQQYMRSFANPVRREITNMKTFDSYSTVEITDNGDVNIYF